MPADSGPTGCATLRRCRGAVGAIAEIRYREPFELIFSTTEFEQRRIEHHTFACSNFREMAARVRLLPGAVSAFRSGAGTRLPVR